MSTLVSQASARLNQSRSVAGRSLKVAKLHEIDPHASAWAIKSWLLGQYARSEPEDSGESDWDRIESAFHHWLRDNRDRLGLHAAVDFRRWAGTSRTAISPNPGSATSLNTGPAPARTVGDVAGHTGSWLA